MVLDLLLRVRGGLRLMLLLLPQIFLFSGQVIPFLFQLHDFPVQPSRLRLKLLDSTLTHLMVAQYGGTGIGKLCACRCRCCGG